MTQPTGAVVEWVTYDIYGKATVRDKNGVVGTKSYVGNPYLYTGREQDPESGLYHYRARAYDPAAGRFLQRDPLGYVDGPSLYQYVASAPARYRDPLGLEDEDNARDANEEYHDAKNEYEHAKREYERALDAYNNRLRPGEENPFDTGGARGGQTSEYDNLKQKHAALAAARERYSRAADRANRFFGDVYLDRAATARTVPLPVWPGRLPPLPKPDPKPDPKPKPKADPCDSPRRPGMGELRWMEGLYPDGLPDDRFQPGVGTPSGYPPGWGPDTWPRSTWHPPGPTLKGRKKK